MDVTSQSPVVEHFDLGLTRTWLYDRRLAIYTIPNTRRETLDVWGQAVQQMIAEWDPNQMYLVMYDFSSRESALTPYARHWAGQLVEAASHLRGDLVVILPNNLIAQVVRLLLDRQYNVKKPGIRRKVFFKQEDGLAWLKQFIED